MNGPARSMAVCWASEAVRIREHLNNVQNAMDDSECVLNNGQFMNYEKRRENTRGQFERDK